MRLLLDTHMLIWLNKDPAQVPERVRAAIGEAESVYASVVSGWEYGLKRRPYPEQLALPFDSLIADLAEPLGLTFDCHRYAEQLPAIHADPFDRMLAAQALHHGLTLVTRDDKLRRYPVETLW